MEVVLGTSVQDRPITAHRFGLGTQKVVLIGDIHGGTEANTYRLMVGVLAHFRLHPDAVPDDAALWIVPTANPDGLVSGTRLNSRGVDLNRNADTRNDPCPESRWQPDTHTSEGIIPGGGGSEPWSEPETQALRDFLADAQVVISYHSQWGAVLAGGCEKSASTLRLVETLRSATGYPVPETGFVAYPVTGDLTDYLALRGVAVATIELTDKVDPELERNLEGILAVLDGLDTILVD
ncbi:MAG: M14 family metallopeptidase [Anaerolineae bacterium]